MFCLGYNAYSRDGELPALLDPARKRLRKATTEEERKPLFKSMVEHSTDLLTVISDFLPRSLGIEWFGKGN